MFSSLVVFISFLFFRNSLLEILVHEADAGWILQIGPPKSFDENQF